MTLSSDTHGFRPGISSRDRAHDTYFHNTGGALCTLPVWIRFPPCDTCASRYHGIHRRPYAFHTRKPDSPLSLPKFELTRLTPHPVSKSSLGSPPYHAHPTVSCRCLHPTCKQIRHGSETTRARNEGRRPVIGWCCLLHLCRAVKYATPTTPHPLHAGQPPLPSPPTYTRFTNIFCKIPFHK